MSWAVALSEWTADDRDRRRLSSQFDCYFPKYRTRVTVNGRRGWKTNLLFGRYFFARIADNWRDLFSTRSIAEILIDKKSGNPARVSDEVIEQLRTSEVDGFIILPGYTNNKLQRGQRCRITKGPFADHCGTYDRYMKSGSERHDREALFITWLGQATKVTVAAGSLVPV